MEIKKTVLTCFISYFSKWIGVSGLFFIYIGCIRVLVCKKRVFSVFIHNSFTVRARIEEKTRDMGNYDLKRDYRRDWVYFLWIRKKAQGN